MAEHYSMDIVWDDEDQTFIVRLPEWGNLASTYGKTYEEAVKNGQEALQGLIESYKVEGSPLPAPRRPTPYTNSDQKPYPIFIHWSEADQLYIASFPGWSDLCHIHGSTREECLAEAQQVLDLLIEGRLAHGEPLPEPQRYRGPRD